MTEPIDQTLEIIELREELQRTKLLLQNCNGDIVRADRELASLREQLAKLETQSHDQVRIIEHLEEKLKQERNKVIDECIDYFSEHYSELGDDGSYIKWTTFEVQKKLESLKRQKS